MRMRILIGKDGRATMRVEGGDGTTCLEFTKAMEQSLGKVEQRTMCAEADVDSLTVPVKVNVRESGR